MDFTFTNDVNIFDLISLIGVVGWVIGLLVGASWLKRRYASRLESDPWRIFQSHVTDLELIVRDMESRDTGSFAREADGSQEADAAGRIAQVMADYRIQDMVYTRWWIACRIPARRGEKPYLHMRPLPRLHILDYR